MDLERAKDDLVAVLGAEMLDERPNDAVLVESLRAALADVCAFAPFEEQVVVLAAGREVDLSESLPDLIEVGSVMREAMHRADAADGKFVRSEYRLLGSTRIQLVGGVQVVAGDTLRVRYRRAYSVEGLDGAEVTSLPRSLFRPWVLRACGEIFDLLLRRKTQLVGKIDDDEGRRFQAIARDYRQRAAKMVNLQTGAQMVTWSNLGE